MLFPTQVRYGLRSIVRLAILQNEEGYIGLKRIAETEKISLKYLEAIFSDLKKAKLVEGQKGKSGGYRLLKKPERISVLEIITALGGAPAPVACLENKETCTFDITCCTVQPLWAELYNVINDLLSKRNLADLMKNNIKNLNKKS